MIEETTMPTMRDEAKKFISHSMVMMPFRSYAMIAQFAVSVFLARVLESAGYGRWGLILAVSQWGYTFFLCWSSSTLTRYGREEFLNSGVVRASMASRFILLLPSLAVLLAVTLGGSGIIARYIHSPRWILALILLYSTGLALSDTVQYLFPAVGRSDLSAAVLAVERTLVLGFLALFYRLEMLNPVAPLISFLAAAWIVNCPVLFIYRKLILPLKKDADNLRRYWKLSKPALLIAPFGGLIGWIDLFFIDHFSGLYDVGRYFLAFQFSTAITQLSFIITMASFSLTILIVVKGRKDLERVFSNRVQYISLLLGSALAMCMTPFVWIVFDYVSGSKGEIMRLVWVLLLPGVIAQFTTATLSSFYMAKEDTWSFLWSGAAKAVINLLLDMLLIPTAGVLGAGLAASASSLFYYWMLCARLRKFQIESSGIVLRMLLFIVPSVLIHFSPGSSPITRGGIIFAAGAIAAAFGAYLVIGLMKRKYE